VQLIIKGLIVVVAVLLQRPGIFTSAIATVRPFMLRAERRKTSNPE
jgi:hypothetical protein